MNYCYLKQPVLPPKDGSGRWDVHDVILQACMKHDDGDAEDNGDDNGNKN